MSEHTLCNHCTVEALKAQRPGVDVIVTQHPRGEMRGWYSARYADRDEIEAYFQQLTVGCAC